MHSFQAMRLPLTLFEKRSKTAVQKRRSYKKSNHLKSPAPLRRYFKVHEDVPMIGRMPYAVKYIDS